MNRRIVIAYAMSPVAAVVGQVAASTQNQAKSALLFLYREVLELELPWLDKVEAAKTSKRLPVVLTSAEVVALLSRLEGTHGLIGRLLYGAGLARTYGAGAGIAPAGSGGRLRRGISAVRARSKVSVGGS